VLCYRIEPMCALQGGLAGNLSPECHPQLAGWDLTIQKEHRGQQRGLRPGPTHRHRRAPLWLDTPAPRWTFTSCCSIPFVRSQCSKSCGRCCRGSAVAQPLVLPAAGCGAAHRQCAIKVKQSFQAQAQGSTVPSCGQQHPPARARAAPQQRSGQLAAAHPGSAALS
jgi:hypothetical protein